MLIHHINIGKNYAEKSTNFRTVLEQIQLILTQIGNFITFHFIRNTESHLQLW